MADQVSVEIATELRAEVEKMILDDPKMLGIARYLASVEVFWSYDIETACAGHGFIFFNPDFYAQLPLPTRNTIMAHEVWHLILKHLDRGEGHDPEDYNRAADHVINNLVEDEGFEFDFTGVVMADGRGFEPVKDAIYKNMSTEEIYNIIHKERKKGNPPKPCNGGKGNPKHVPKSVIDDLVKAAADKIASNTDYNNVPDQIKADEERLEDLNIPTGKNSGYTHLMLEITGTHVAIAGSTYEEIFAEYLIDPISGARRSFMRPNRRMHGASGFQLPGRVVRKSKSNRLAHLIYALDVSGSITAEQAQQFHDSVATIKELLNPNLLTVIFWDTQIKLIKTFKDTEPYTKIQVQAGGCTCLKAVYKYIATRDPDAVVIFTDLAVNIPKEPKWHTIWLVPINHREATVPGLYGDVYIIPKMGDK